MSEECSHNCSDCASDCADRKNNPKEFLQEPNPLSNIKKVIAVMSGKGGVGKSMVTSLLAHEMNRKGYKVAILDADITGPSIPTAFGINETPQAAEEGILPVKSKDGISIISVNLLLDNFTDPVIWRGPVVAGMVKQFWSDVIWEDIDYMFVDMPPGTADVPLTVFQSIPVDGIVIVTSPQQLVEMIVQKAVNMANKMEIPVLGLVENMSYFECPECGKRYEIFGISRLEEAAKSNNIGAVCKMPIMPELTALNDEGRIEESQCELLGSIIEAIE